MIIIIIIIIIKIIIKIIIINLPYLRELASTANHYLCGVN